MNLTIVNTQRYAQIKQTPSWKTKQKASNDLIKGASNNYTTPIFFTSNLKQNSGLENAFNDFMKEIEEVYGNMPICDVVDYAMSEENIIGEGSAKVVYKIPNVDDYVIGREKRIPYSKQDFIKMDIPFNKYNFGQPIAQNNSGITIMKKVVGKAHSLGDWSKKVDNFLFDKPMELIDAKEFLASMKEISELPLSAYINLAKQIKYLSDNGHRLDILSPNNVLIDLKNQQMHLIDLIDGQERFADFEGDLNTLYDLENILCGTILHEVSRKQLSEIEAEELDEATIEILKKCKMAGDYVGLSRDKTNTIKFYNIMDGFVSHFLGCEPKFLETYMQFADRYESYIN